MFITIVMCLVMESSEDDQSNLLIFKMNNMVATSHTWLLSFWNMDNLNGNVPKCEICCGFPSLHVKINIKYYVVSFP